MWERRTRPSPTPALSLATAPSSRRQRRRHPVLQHYRASRQDRLGQRRFGQHARPESDRRQRNECHAGVHRRPPSTLIPLPMRKNRSSRSWKQATRRSCRAVVRGDVGADGAVAARILGHGGVGNVEATGQAVGRIRPGDRVLVTSVPNCGACYNCIRGRSEGEPLIQAVGDRTTVGAVLSFP